VVAASSALRTFDALMPRCLALPSPIRISKLQLKRSNGLFKGRGNVALQLNRTVRCCCYAAMLSVWLRQCGEGARQEVSQPRNLKHPMGPDGNEQFQVDLFLLQDEQYNLNIQSIRPLS
jgi:hypothetical protein